MKMSRSDLPSFLSALLVVALGTTACSERNKTGSQPQAGRVTALAEIIWACPLENWRLGDDEGCDPIATGTALKIHRRNVQPDYPHGPFAFVEYTAQGVTKMQYVKDSTVAPLGDDPTVEDMVDRELQR